MLDLKVGLRRFFSSGEIIGLKAFHEKDEFEMSGLDKDLEGLGLHGQATETMLKLLATKRAELPTLAAVSKCMDIPEEQLRSIFADEDAILTAAAEKALIRLMDHVTKAVVKADQNDPIAQFKAIGAGYLEWADENHQACRLITNNAVLNALQIPQLRRYLNSLNDLMVRTLTRAQATGQLSPQEDLHNMVVSHRVFGHGLSRLIVDSSGPNPKTGQTALAVAQERMADFIHRYVKSSA